MTTGMAKGGSKAKRSGVEAPPHADAVAAEKHETGAPRGAEASSVVPLRDRLKRLYDGRTRRAYRFRYGLLIFDIVTLLFVIATSFVERNIWIEIADIAFGVLILADFCARLIISDKPLREFLHPVTWADLAAIVSFLAPLAGEAVGFLRVLRTLRLLHSYQLLTRLRADFPYFRTHEEVIIAVANLGVFLFVMTGFVYETQHMRNPAIHNYADALYFTVTALTTTGFGDITLPGTAGRLLSVIIMIFGVTLFFQLARAILQPAKVRFQCPACGLMRHDVDAVHCKACGELLNIPNEDLD
jgi:voltage-gated potassium channel